jgi:hypothetical protein
MALVVLMLSAIMLIFIYAEYHYSELRYPESYGALTL